MMWLRFAIWVILMVVCAFVGNKTDNVFCIIFILISPVIMFYVPLFLK